MVVPRPPRTPSLLLDGLSATIISGFLSDRDMLTHRLC